MADPTVSVILPVYNGENYLREAIDSVMSQTFRDYELIVVDDGSSDSTPEIALEYGEALRYVRQENTGVAGAFNHGLRIASGRYISWLSHDDRFLPAKLQMQVDALAGGGAPGISYTDIQIIDSRGCVVFTHELPQHRRGEALRHILTGGAIGSACYSIMYSRECIEEVGFYSQSWRYTQDTEMLMRLAKRFPFVHVPHAVMQVREHDSRGVRSVQWQREALAFFRLHLDVVPLEELFPEYGPHPSRKQRAVAAEWLGDALTKQGFPVYLLAGPQYRRAIRADPISLPRLQFKLLRVLRRRIRARLSQLKHKLV